MEAIADKVSIVDAKHWAVKLLWLFVLGSVAGLLIEEVYHLMVYQEIQNRAGLLFGPFSPIYGCGLVCMTVLAAHVKERPALVVFIASAITGGAVEFATSLIMQSQFGIVAWDYTGTWLSLDGRTNGYFMCMWGLLGLVCVKVIVPAFDGCLLPKIKRLPSELHKLLAVFMAANIVLTVVSLDCWNDRQSGVEASTPIHAACNAFFDDDFMASHFQTMVLDQKIQR